MIPYCDPKLLARSGIQINMIDTKKQTEEIVKENNNTKEKFGKFNEELFKLQQKYAVVLYAAVQLSQDGEIVPIVKLRDAFKINIVK